MNQPYSTQWFPPMPVLEIRLGYPDASLSVGPCTAIIDTGADGCLVPVYLLDEIQAPLVDDVRLRSQWGEWRRAQVFVVDVGIGSLRLPAVQVVGDKQGDEIVLGRNVLNKLRLLLDGPAAETRVMA